MQYEEKEKIAGCIAGDGLVGVYLPMTDSKVKKVSAKAAGDSGMVQGEPGGYTGLLHPIAVYDFNGGSGMSFSEIEGSLPPSIVKDAERKSQVLYFADGASSSIITKAGAPSLGKYDLKVDMGMPSSLRFPNHIARKQYRESAYLIG